MPITEKEFLYHLCKGLWLCSAVQKLPDEQYKEYIRTPSKDSLKLPFIKALLDDYDKKHKKEWDEIYKNMKKEKECK